MGRCPGPAQSRIRAQSGTGRGGGRVGACGLGTPWSVCGGHFRLFNASLWSTTLAGKCRCVSDVQMPVGWSVLSQCVRGLVSAVSGSSLSMQARRGPFPDFSMQVWWSAIRLARACQETDRPMPEGGHCWQYVRYVVQSEMQGGQRAYTEGQV